MIIKKAAFAAWGLLALACGADTGDGGEYTDLDTAEQEFSGHVTDSFQFGTRTASNQRRCDRVTVGQICTVFDDLTPTWCSASTGTGAFTSDDRTQLTNVVGGLDSLLTNWAFTQQGSGCSAPIAFRKAVVSGSLTFDIRNYVSVQLGVGSSLTEGSGVVGQYQSHSTCLISIDVDDINARAPSDLNQRNRLFRHAARHGLNKCLGLGGRAGSPNTSTREVVQSVPGASDFFWTNAELCQLNGFSLSGSGQYFHDTPDCSGD
jgi:hypothetical protein